MLSSRSGVTSMHVQLNGAPDMHTFTPKPGMLYYLPAQF